MVEGNEDSFGVLRLLESPHGFESRIEVTDIGFQPVCDGRNARIEEVGEGIAASFAESLEDIVVDGIETEEICFNETLKMLPAQEEGLRSGMEEELAVTEQDPFLFVPRMIAESLHLQSGLDVPE